MGSGEGRGLAGNDQVHATSDLHTAWPYWGARSEGKGRGISYWDWKPGCLGVSPSQLAYNGQPS